MNSRVLDNLLSAAAGRTRYQRTMKEAEKHVQYEKEKQEGNPDRQGKEGSIPRPESIRKKGADENS